MILSHSINPQQKKWDSSDYRWTEADLAFLMTLWKIPHELSYLHAFVMQVKKDIVFKVKLLKPFLMLY